MRRGPVEAAVPTQEQEHGEQDDHEADTRLGRPLHALGQVGAVEDHRQAEDEQRRRMAEPPGQAEPRCATGCALPAGRDHRRDRGEMIWIARVPQAEEHRHTDDDQQRRPVREGGDPVVEAEHRYLTLGRAWSVIPTPAARITSALTAGSSETRRPSKLSRRNTPRARTAARPIPVIVNASPALNATTRSIPNATRCSEIAARSTTRADGQGRRPPETPTASSERRLRSCS